MARWQAKVVQRVRTLAALRQVSFTLKARREFASLRFAFEEQDVCDVLARLTAHDSVGRLISERTGEWLYLFKPVVADTVIYLKIILRTRCIVVSFHEDEGSSHDQEG